MSLSRAMYTRWWMRVYDRELVERAQRVELRRRRVLRPPFCRLRRLPRLRRRLRRVVRKLWSVSRVRHLRTNTSALVGVRATSRLF